MLEAAAAPIEPNIGIRVKSKINVNTTPTIVAMRLICRLLLAKGMMERTLEEQAKTLPIMSIFNKNAVSANSFPKTAGISHGDKIATARESNIIAVLFSRENRNRMLILS